MHSISAQPDRPTLSFPPDLFQRPDARRVLFRERWWGFLVAAFKAHGRRPDNYANFRYNGLALNVVLGGRGTYREANGRTWGLRPGSVFHRFPGVRHSTFLEPDGEYAEFYLTFDQQTARRLLDLGLLGPDPVRSCVLDRAILDGMEELHALVASPETRLSNQDLLLRVVQFCQDLYRRGAEADHPDPWDQIVREACRRLRESRAERTPLEQVAGELGVSYASLRRQFQARTGQSPGAYRLRQRLEQACHLLPDFPVKEVADQLGYPEPFTFSAQFKKHLGLSPNAFRRRARGRD